MTHTPAPPAMLEDAAPLPRPGTAAPLTLAERAALDENDADNAQRILSEWGRDLLYVINRGWLVWDGIRYAGSAGELSAFAVAARLRRLLEAEAEWLFANAEVGDWQINSFLATPKGLQACLKLVADEGATLNAAAEKLLRARIAVTRRKYAVTCGNVERINKALDYCRHLSSARVSDLDADPLVFVCANGQVNLHRASKDGRAGHPTAAQRRAWLEPTCRTSLPTRASPTRYDPDAACPEWRRFVALIMPDPLQRDALQRCLGYLLSGDNPEAACMILRGPGGNGKSTLLNAISAVMGEEDGYVAPSCDIMMFMVTPEKSQGGHSTDEMKLIGARVYVAAEPAPTDTFSLKKIKSLTGGDRKSTRVAYEKHELNWTPRGVPLLSCNKTPRIADDDPGTRRRLIFIPLEVDLKALPEDRRIPQHEMDAMLAAEAPGILNWLIDGWIDYKRQRGLNLPANWLALRDRLMEEADPVGQFMRECTVAVPDGRVRRAHFNAAYHKWAAAEGGAEWSGRAVNRAMKEKGFSEVKVHGGHMAWPGLSWSPEAYDLLIAAGVPADEIPPSAPSPATVAPF